MDTMILIDNDGNAKMIVNVMMSYITSYDEMKFV